MFGVADETGFIELDRTFHELSAESGKSGDADLQRSLFRRDPLTWTDLTKEFRAIILSEAGTGKTQELRHAARVLRAQGKAAFFLRLEFVPVHFQDAFEVGTFQEFRTWLASTTEGWLFCDSVDESLGRSSPDRRTLRECRRRYPWHGTMSRSRSTTHGSFKSLAANPLAAIG